jgi:hypothetical protein
MTSSYIERVAEQIRRAVDPELLPDGNVEALLLMYAVLALAKGENTSARDVHDAWAAWMASTDPSHESIKPYDDLPADIQQQDAPFVAAIHDASRTLDDG